VGIHNSYRAPPEIVHFFHFQQLGFSRLDYSPYYLRTEVIMKISLNRAKWAFYLAGTLALATPATGWTAGDNERWNQGQAELQKHLAPGQPADAYRKKLEELGYKVTSTNYHDDDYVEYEVVKGDQTWEVQIDVDEDTNKATKVDIAMNMWKTDATDEALEHSDRMAGGDHYSAYGDSRRAAAVRSNQYSDRDRSMTDQMIKELEALPVGHDKQFYKDALRKRGYEISRVNKDDDDELDLEAVKAGRSVQMDIDFDEDSGRSTEIDASSLWAESEATTKTREAQKTRTPARVPAERMSDAERMSRHTDR
jgi:hypothetical protein